MYRGHVKFWRCWLDEAIFHDAELLKIYLYGMVKARHKDGPVSWKTGKGSTQVSLKRGEVLYGRSAWAERLNMAPSTVEDKTRKLTRMGLFHKKPDSHYSIITVENYDLWQPKEEDTPTPSPTPNRHPTDTQPTQIRIISI